MPFMEPVISGMYGTCPANFWRCAPLKSAPLLRYMLILTPIFAFIKLLFDLYMYNNNESRAEMLEDEIVDMQSN
jgi:hypothetical protein